VVLSGLDVVLRWAPNGEPWFYNYEVLRRTSVGSPASIISPTPLRSATWTDSGPAPGAYRYGVRAVSASGVRSAVAWSSEIRVSS
jgi:hypothetical protein